MRNPLARLDFYKRRLMLWLVVVALANVGTAATVPPRYRFLTLREGRVTLHFHAEVQATARRTMALVLEILPRLEERYRVRVPNLEVVVHDVHDASNGLAISFPYPLVEIRAASPDGAESGPTESWLRLVVTHELTHIVHIEQARGVFGAGRRVFGRAPFLFPDALQPTWFIEGLAVREETRGTAYGRGRHTFTKMVVDEASRSGQLLKLDQATLGLDLWPLGNAPYLFGEEFLRYLDETRGENVSRDIALAHASSFPPYVDTRTFKRVTRSSLESLWKQFAVARAASLVPPKPSTPLTHRGAVQITPRLSPDRSQIAYASRTLNRRGEIRLMKPDGSGDRRLTWRLSGSGLSWSRDGSFLVFDETAPFRKFETRSDLFSADVLTGRRRRLSRGLRASDPDIDPRGDPRHPSVVFVQRFADRSELSVLRPDLTSRELTSSPPGTEWSRPRYSPSGDVIAAARMASGLLDVVLVDPGTGAVTNLTNDRAVDAEPSWLDDDTIIFRSDRESQAFRLFAIRRDGARLARLEGPSENAFSPEPDRSAGAVYYARYSAQGFDISRAPLRIGEEAGSFEDYLPAALDDPPPFVGEAKSYRSFRSLRPRFVTPYAERVSDEWRLGLATASLDPLGRLTYGVAGSWGTTVSRANGLAYLRYDRYTPSITALARIESQPSSDGSKDLAEGRLSLEFPLERSIRRSQNLVVTARRRREVSSRPLDTTAVGASWQFDSTTMLPMSISPQEGLRFKTSWVRQLKSWGGDLDFSKVVVEAAAYVRAGGSVIAARAGAGWALGARAPRQSFEIGGLSSSALLDPVGDRPAVLRGYEPPTADMADRFGRRLLFGNLDWRVPLVHPQRGLGALPLFLRHLALTAGIDAAAVGERRLDLKGLRLGAFVGLSADVFLGHRIPVTLQGGVGRGLNRDGDTVPWFSLGFPF